MSPRDIKPIVDKAYQEKERQEHRSLSTQAYDLFSKGKKLVEVAIMLNIKEIQVTEYYSEYLRLTNLDALIRFIKKSNTISGSKGSYSIIHSQTWRNMVEN